jgi:Ala-tRNA(Pro) deacylase
MVRIPPRRGEKEAPMPILTKLRELLEHEKVPYSVHSHPEAYTALEIAALEHVKGRMLAKVVIVKTGVGELVMVVLPADRRVDFRKVAAVLGTEELRLAQESEFRDTFPACDVGAMPPFGNLFGVPVLVDELLAENEEIVFNAGTHTLTAKLRFADLRRLVQPRIASLSVPIA